MTHLIKVFSEIQHLKPVNVELMSVTESAIKDLQEFIQVAREVLREKPDCNHKTNDLQDLFTKLLDKKDFRPEAITGYVNQQKSRVSKNLRKIFLAPGEDGNFQNWESDIFLEEKLFPARIGSLGGLS